MRKKVLEFDKVLDSNRFYEIKLASSIIGQFPNKGLMGSINGKDSIADISHVAKNPTLNGNSLEVDIEILDTPEGKVLKDFNLTHDVDFYTVGVGSLVMKDVKGHKGVMTAEDYVLQDIRPDIEAATPKSILDAFKVRFSNEL